MRLTMLFDAGSVKRTPEADSGTGSLTMLFDAGSVKPYTHFRYRCVCLTMLFDAGSVKQHVITTHSLFLHNIFEYNQKKPMYECAFSSFLGSLMIDYYFDVVVPLFPFWLHCIK